MASLQAVAPVKVTLEGGDLGGVRTFTLAGADVQINPRYRDVMGGNGLPVDQEYRGTDLVISGSVIPSQEQLAAAVPAVRPEIALAQAVLRADWLAAYALRDLLAEAPPGEAAWIPQKPTRECLYCKTTEQLRIGSDVDDQAMKIRCARCRSVHASAPLHLFLTAARVWDKADRAVRTWVFNEAPTLLQLLFDMGFASNWIALLPPGVAWPSWMAEGSGSPNEKDIGEGWRVVLGWPAREEADV